MKRGTAYWTRGLRSEQLPDGSSRIRTQKFCTVGTVLLNSVVKFLTVSMATYRSCPSRQTDRGSMRKQEMFDVLFFFSPGIKTFQNPSHPLRQVYRPQSVFTSAFTSQFLIIFLVHGLKLTVLMWTLVVYWPARVQNYVIFIILYIWSNLILKIKGGAEMFVTNLSHPCLNI